MTLPALTSMWCGALEGAPHLCVSPSSQRRLYVAIEDEFVLALGKEGYRQLCQFATNGELPGSSMKR